MTGTKTFEELLAAGDFEGAQALLDAAAADSDAARAAAEREAGFVFECTVDQYDAGNLEADNLSDALTAAFENLIDQHGSDAAVVAIFGHLLAAV